jgi:hypothetical protein
MHNGPAPSRHRRGKNRTTVGRSDSVTPPNEDLDTLHLPSLTSPDGVDLLDAGDAPRERSDTAYPDIHPLEFSLEGTSSVMEL